MAWALSESIFCWPRTRADLLREERFPPDAVCVLDFFSPTGVEESLAPRHIEDVRASLERFAVEHNTTPRAMTLAQRHQAVKALADSGLLNLKNAVSETAQILGVARSTVYTYLPDAREKS